MIGVYMPASAITDEQYEAVVSGLPADGPPAGMKLHTCFREGSGLAIFDVWESREAFEAFTEVLMPLVAAAGATLSSPIFVEMVDYQTA